MGGRRGERRNKEEEKQKLKRRRWEKEKEARERGNAAHRETVKLIVVVRRVDVSTIEIEAVRVRSTRISSSWPVVAIEARAPQ